MYRAGRLGLAFSWGIEPKFVPQPMPVATEWIERRRSPPIIRAPERPIEIDRCTVHVEGAERFQDVPHVLLIAQQGRDAARLLRIKRGRDGGGKRWMRANLDDHRAASLNDL